MLASGRKAQTNSAGRENARNGRRNGRTDGASRYEVLERLGEGTLWIVYRVRERTNKTTPSKALAAAPLLALKALKQAANRHPRLPQALIQSLRRFADLSHPNLAAVRDVNIEDETLYFTQDWLPAPSLETRLSRGPVPVPQAQSWLAGIAGALAYLHGRDLPHGDVRPRQILFSENGQPVLTDGGIAAAFAESGLALADVQGEVAHYLAPERSQGAGLSAAADVYALGVCFYRMLCGRVPFDGASALAIAARHRNEAVVPPSHFNERVGSEWDDLALRLLEKDPAQRPTAADLHALLNDSIPVAPNATAPDAATAPVAVVDATAPDATAPDATAPDATAPDATAPDATAPDATAPDATAPDATAPDVAAVVAPVELEKKTPAAPGVVGPKRRPLDEVVAETMSQEAEAKREEVIKRARRKHKWREFSGAIGALLGLLLMIGALGGLIYGAYNYWLGEIPAEVVVPRYVGQSSEQAKALLSKKGLKMKVVRESYDPKKPEGTVLTGDPQPGRKVRSQREVLVTVSAGSAPIKMVDFSRLSLEQARAIILQHGLRLGQSIEQYHPRVPRGYICGQYPDAGDPLRRSEPITLIVSRGPQPTDIDAQKGLGVDQGDVVDPTDGSNGGTNNASGLSALPQGGTDFTPLEAAPNAPASPANSADDGDANNASDNAAPPSNELKNKRATITVNVPRDGGRQVVRIVVRDSNGERTIYQRSRPAGSTVSRTVRATRPDSDPALVRVYVGDELVREDNL